MRRLPYPPARLSISEQDPGEVDREFQLVRRLLLGTAVGAVAALPFLGLLLLIRTGYAPLAAVDGDVAAALNSWALNRPDVVTLLELLEQVSSPWTFRVLVAIAAAVLWQYGRRRLATWAIVTMAAGSLLGVVLKLVVGRARPVFDLPASAAGGLSFPSGHALNSMLGVAVLLLIGLPLLGRRGRVVAWTAGVGTVAVTAFDRVGLGVHFLTDVLAGWALALALVAGTTTAFGTWRRSHPAADDIELELARTSDRDLRATLAEVARLLGRALLTAIGLVALMVTIGLLVTGVLKDLAALDSLNELTRQLAVDRTPTRNAVSKVFSRASDTSTTLVTMLIVAVILRAALGRWRESAFMVLAVSLQALVFVTTQLLVSRARPDVVQLDPAAATTSFPSGHTSAAVALYGSLAVVLLWRTRPGSTPPSGWRPRWVRALAVVLLLVPLAVAWSRLYRGLHFPLDVAGSFVQAGLAIAMSVRLVLLAQLPEHLSSLLDGRPPPAPPQGADQVDRGIGSFSSASP